MKPTLMTVLALALTVLPLGAQTPKGWTVLVYMAADNDLEEAALDDLKEMLEVGSSADVNLVVQVDRATGYTADGVGGLKDWTDAKRLFVQKGKLQEISDLGETNTGDPKVLADFVAWGLKTYPAQRTALVLWDHGGGQSGFSTDESADGAGLSIPALKAAISGGLKAARGVRLDLIGFDACLMAAYETARALAPSARYLLASEETEPGFGWDWRTMGLLVKNPAATPVQLGSALIASFAAYCQENDEGAQFTLSLTDLDKLEPIEAALKTLDGAAVPRLQVLGGDFGRARFKSVEFGKSGDPADDTQMVDLGDLARQWQANPVLASGALALGAAVTAAVVDKKGGTVQKAATGMSIWFPSEKQYYDPAYAEFGSPLWVHLLERYYDAGTKIPPEERAGASPGEPQAAEGDEDTGVSLADGEVTFTRPFDRKVLKNITEALLYYGTVDAQGGALVLGSRDADIDLEAGEVTGFWDLTALTLVQGKVKVPVFLSEDQADEKIMAFSVPFSYYPDGNVKKAKSKEDVWLSVTIDLGKNEIVEETYFQETEGGQVGEFQPEDGSRLVAQLLVRGKDGEWDYVDRGPALDPTRTIDYEFKDLDPGQKFYLSLDISDYGGNDDSQEFEGTLE